MGPISWHIWAILSCAESATNQGPFFHTSVLTSVFLETQVFSARPEDSAAVNSASQFLSACDALSLLELNCNTYLEHQSLRPRSRDLCSLRLIPLFSLEIVIIPGYRLPLPLTGGP